MGRSRQGTEPPRDLEGEPRGGSTCGLLRARRAAPRLRRVGRPLACWSGLLGCLAALGAGLLVLRSPAALQATSGLANLPPVATILRREGLPGVHAHLRVAILN